MNTRPPRISARILAWLLDDVWDTPAGDFEEYFNQMVDAHGEHWARRWYRRQVLSMLPGRITERTNQGIRMIASNLKVAFRALKRHAWFSAVNIGGLAVVIAACILIALYIQDELTFDDMHGKADRIVRVVETETTPDGGEQQLVFTMNALGPAMAQEIPEVQTSVRMLSRQLLGRQTVRFGDNMFYEGEYLTVDSTFFDVFDYRFISGDPQTALDRPGKVVLTESAVERYFGDVDPMGKTLELERQGDLTVSAVIADPPPDTHLHFSMLCSLSTMHAFPGWMPFLERWSTQTAITYVVLQPGTSVDVVQTKMQDLLLRNASEETLETRSFRLQVMSDVHFGSRDIDFDRNAGATSRSTITMLALIGFFILAIACINYTNMTTASSMQRAKEVGLRKTVGAYRGQLVKQFMSESLATTLLALVAAVGIALAMLGPFNTLTDRSLSMSPADNPVLIPLLIVFALFVGVASGSYPAFFLSRFQPASVLKGGGAATGGGRRVRQGLVLAQFTLSIGLIMASLIVYRQLQYLQSANLGFNEDQLMVVDINAGGPRAGFRSMKAELNALPAVQDVSVSSNVPGDWKNITQIDVRNAEGSSDDLATSYFLGIDSDFLETFQINLLQGRNFAENAIADSMAVLVTESTARRLDLAVGDRIHIPGSSLQGSFSRTDFEPSVIGIVNDFNFRSLRESIDPMVLGYHTNPVDVIDYFTIRIAPTDVQGTIASLRVVGEKFDPDHPFEFNFLDERIQNFYQEETRLGRMFGIATGLAILIACLGLFGLAAYTTARRTKEIGVRKALGATVPSIVLLLSRDIVRLVLVAFVIASPLAWLAMDRWLDGFAFRVTLGVGIFLVAGGLSLVFALLTVSWQSIRAALADPVNSLRYE